MSSNRFRRALVAIALGGLALRLIYAYAIVKSRPLNGDALEFHLQANLLADGHGYVQPYTWQLSHIARATADKPPVYPLLEAIVSLVGGRSWAWHDVVGLLAGTGTVVLVALIGRRVAGALVGLIAAAIAAAYPLLIASDASLRSEPVYTFLVTAALLATLRLRESPTIKRAVVLGVIIGLAALTRAEALLLLVLLPFALVGARRGLVTVATCVLILLPWLVRCWIDFGQPVLISTNVGGLLAGANCAPTYSGPLLGQWDLNCLSPPRSTNEAHMSDDLRADGLRYAREHASRLPIVIAARVGRSFELFRPAQQWQMEMFYEGRNLFLEKVGVLVYYVVALLAIPGAVILARRRGPWRLLLAPLAIVLFVSVTGYGFTRFRAVAEPVLIIFAAVAIATLVENRSTLLARRRSAVTA